MTDLSLSPHTSVAALGGALTFDSIAGLLVDLDGDKGVTLNGSTVSVWRDQKSGYLWTPDTAAQEPLYDANDPDFNGHGSLRGVTNDTLKNADIGPLLSGDDTPYTIIKVCSRIADNNDRLYGLGHATLPSRCEERWGGTSPNHAPWLLREDDAALIAQATPVTPTILTNTPLISTMVYTGSEVNFWLQGVPGSGSPIALSVGECTFDRMYLMARYDTGAVSTFSEMKYARLLIWGRALGAGEVGLAESLADAIYKVLP